MSLDDLESDLTATAGDLDDELSVSLDRETRTELAMLVAAFEPDDPDELFRRGIHDLFQMAVDTGRLDFQLRSKYGITYDEYLSGMTYEEMTGGAGAGSIGGPDGGDPDDRRYQF